LARPVRGADAGQVVFELGNRLFHSLFCIKLNIVGVHGYCLFSELRKLNHNETTGTTKRKSPTVFVP